MKRQFEFILGMTEKFREKNKKVPKELVKTLDCYAGLELKYENLKHKFGGAHILHILSNGLCSIRAKLDLEGLSVLPEINSRLEALHTYASLVAQSPEFRKFECGELEEKYFLDIEDYGNRETGQNLPYHSSSCINYCLGSIERFRQSKLGRTLESS